MGYYLAYAVPMILPDSIIVALVAGCFNIAAVVVGRLLSRHEHKKTARDVREIRRLLNGVEPHGAD